jgi:hypothetical protein
VVAAGRARSHFLRVCWKRSTLPQAVGHAEVETQPGKLVAVDSPGELAGEAARVWRDRLKPAEHEIMLVPAGAQEESRLRTTVGDTAIFSPVRLEQTPVQGGTAGFCEVRSDWIRWSNSRAFECGR